MPRNTTDFLGNPIGSCPAIGSGDGKAIACAVKRFIREAIALRHLGAVPVALLQGHLAVRRKYYENISIERYVLAGMKFEEMKDATVRHTVMGKSVGGSLRNFARWPTRSLTESASRINDAFASINDSAQCLFPLVRPYVH